jgi:Protein of unknown function (DUF3703)
MHAELRRAYDGEMQAAIEFYDGDNLGKAFFHLERAHILGQSFTCSHARTHWWMLKVGVKRRDFTEIIGQVVRILGALSFSRIWVPIGNTGGAQVPPFTSMPIPEEFESLLKRHGRG